MPSPVSIFSYTLPQKGAPVPLRLYSGKVTLVVNTASRCSFTASNIGILNDLQRTYEARGFTVLACPSNSFAGQEPLSNEDLEGWRRDMSVTFPVFDKVDVKGKNADPLFAMLQEHLGKARWNYTKYLCDRSGTPVQRFDAGSAPSVLHESIEKFLL